MSTTIDTSILEVRNNLSSLVEEAHYTNTQFRLTRHNKPLVRIVGEQFMMKLEQLLAQDESLKETFEIMLDRELSEDIRISQEEFREGKRAPLRNLLKE